MAAKVTYDIRTSSDSAVLVQTNADSTGDILQQYDEENDVYNALIDAGTNAQLASLLTNTVTTTLIKAGTGSGYNLTTTTTDDVEPHFNSQVYHVSATQSFKLLASDDGYPMLLEVGVVVHNSHGSNAINVTLDDAYVIASPSRVVTIPSGGAVWFKMMTIDSKWFISTALVSNGNSLSLSTINWKGAWSSITAYVPNDAVSVGGSSYINIFPSTGNTPPNPTYWNVLAQAGVAGSTGGVGHNAGYTYIYNGNVNSGQGPATGRIKFNSLTLASITNCNIHQSDNEGHLIVAEIDTWANSTATIKGTLYVFQNDTPTTFVLFHTGAVTNPQSSNYRQVALTYVAGNGTFTDAGSGTAVTVLFLRSGNGA